MKNKINEQKDKSLFDRISTKYAKKDIYPVSKLARICQIKCMIDYVSEEYQINSVNSLLELGCGHGANSEYFEGFYKNYLGIDYSEELVKIAKDHYIKENIFFAVDNIKESGKYGKFDLVVGIGILHHVDNMQFVLNKMKELGHDKTVYLFYEPQRGNPLIKLLRYIRMKIDSSYSTDQLFFKKQELEEMVSKCGFKNVKSRSIGYFTPPFAQVILKPRFIFLPICKVVISIDKFLFKNINNKLAWSFIISFTK